MSYISMRSDLDKDEQLISDNGIRYQNISGITILNNDYI